MDFEAQDSLKLIILMIAGAIFACAGLYLLLRRNPEGSTAKIELFGLKFESSSAGLLVFLIGAVFLAIPLFVPEKAGRASVIGGPRGGADAAQPAPGGAVVLPATPDAAEIEPNERVQDANQLAIGATVSGKVIRGDIDWYVISTEGEQGKILVVTLRHTGGSHIYGEVFNEDERRIGQLSASSGAAVEREEITGPVAYVKVTVGVLKKPAEYELTTRLEEL
ncbi:MAG: hypothetical protein AB3N15_10110 [Paracoccaceae bacterium]